MSDHASSLKQATIWTCGFLASLFLVNLFCLGFANSSEVSAWEDALDYSVPIAGQRHRHRTEGWANTRIGRYGINGITDIGRLQGPKIAFWGDSHVEGFPLADEEKLAQQFNRIPQAGDERLAAFAVGFSGTTIGTALHLMPAYEKLAPPLRYHFIVITRLSYILPDEHSMEPVSLHTHPRPGLHIRGAPRPDARRQTALRLLRRFHLPLAYHLYRQASRIGLRFRIGGLDGDSAPEEQPDIPSLAAAWSVLLEGFADRTDIPIAFVYSPRIPFLDRGHPSFDDPDEGLIRTFADQCREHGFPFLSLHEEFSELYRTTGRFPRGFANNNPYKGHLNEDGSRLVAEKVATFLAE